MLVTSKRPIPARNALVIAAIILPLFPDRLSLCVIVRIESVDSTESELHRLTLTDDSSRSLMDRMRVIFVKQQIRFVLV
jgi:hypothetical protein